MVTTLPQPVRLKLEQALGQWQHWRTPSPLQRKPETLARLDGGRSNYAVKVGGGEQVYVIRLDGVSHQELGLNRLIEYRAQLQAAEAGLAPQPCYFNPDLGVLVSCWHETAADPPDRAEELTRIGGLLRGIHALPALHYRLRPLDRARRYRDIAGTNGDFPQGFLAACDRLDAHPFELRLCHNDLLAANRLLSENGLLALDWEYAAMGDPVFDLAAVIEGDVLTTAEVEILLNAYELEEDQALRLEDQRLVYRELAFLWEQATGA